MRQRATFRIQLFPKVQHTCTAHRCHTQSAVSGVASGSFRDHGPLPRGDGLEEFVAADGLGAKVHLVPGSMPRSQRVHPAARRRAPVAAICTEPAELWREKPDMDVYTEPTLQPISPAASAPVFASHTSKVCTRTGTTTTADDDEEEDGDDEEEEFPVRPSKDPGRSMIARRASTSGVEPALGPVLLAQPRDDVVEGRVGGHCEVLGLLARAPLHAHVPEAKHAALPVELRQERDEPLAAAPRLGGHGQEALGHERGHERWPEGARPAKVPTVVQTSCETTSGSCGTRSGVR